MMTAQQYNRGLIDRLPPVQGRYQFNAPLSKFTWFRVGGPAEALFRPADVDDLQQFLAATPTDIPVSVIGVGSNLLVRDGGIPGVVVRLGEGFADITTEDDRVAAGAGASNLKVANVAREAALGGLEFLSGIPGSIGGSIRMNAGAFGRETRDVFDEAIGLERDGQERRFTPADIGFAYRHSELPADVILIQAWLRAAEASRDSISTKMADIQAERATTQPTQTPTGGSTFVNPPGAKAWELIDAAGCRGLQRGGASVSEKHCNFLINNGTATAADLEGLGEEVRRRVFENAGIELEWEIQRVGAALGPSAREVAS